MESSKGDPLEKNPRSADDSTGDPVRKRRRSYLCVSECVCWVIGTRLLCDLNAVNGATRCPNQSWDILYPRYPGWTQLKPRSEADRVQAGPGRPEVEDLGRAGRAHRMAPGLCRGSVRGAGRIGREAQGRRSLQVRPPVITISPPSEPLASGGRSHTKPGSLLESQIPIRTWAVWTNPRTVSTQLFVKSQVTKPYIV
jgi:hypothetical protein